MYIAFKISFLVLVQQVARSVQEHNGGVFGQGIFIKISGVFSGIYLKPVFLPQFGKGSNARGGWKSAGIRRFWRTPSIRGLPERELLQLNRLNTSTQNS